MKNGKDVKLTSLPERRSDVVRNLIKRNVGVKNYFDKKALFPLTPIELLYAL
jgi:hypothetical protein